MDKLCIGYGYVQYIFGYRSRHYMVLDKWPYSIVWQNNFPIYGSGGRSIQSYIVRTFLWRISIIVWINKVYHRQFRRNIRFSWATEWSTSCFTFSDTPNHIWLSCGKYLYFSSLHGHVAQNSVLLPVGKWFVFRQN